MAKEKVQLNVTFGQNVSKYRKLKNMSQDEFAFQVGVSKESISKIENGWIQPQAETIEKITSVLEIKPFMLYLENPQTDINLFKELILNSLTTALNEQIYNPFSDPKYDAKHN